MKARDNATATLAILDRAVKTIEHLLERDYDEMGNDQGSSRNQREATAREAKEGLYASQNSTVRETRRTLLELLNE